VVAVARMRPNSSDFQAVLSAPICPSSREGRPHEPPSRAPPTPESFQVEPIRGAEAALFATHPDALGPRYSMHTRQTPILSDVLGMNPWDTRQIQLHSIAPI